MLIFVSVCVVVKVAVVVTVSTFVLVAVFVRQGPGVVHVVWDGTAIHVGIRPTMQCDGAVQFGHCLFGADTFPV